MHYLNISQRISFFISGTRREFNLIFDTYIYVCVCVCVCVCVYSVYIYAENI